MKITETLECISVKNVYKYNSKKEEIEEKVVIFKGDGYTITIQKEREDHPFPDFSLKDLGAEAKITLEVKKFQATIEEFTEVK